MNTIQIYDKNVVDDELGEIIDKLKAVHVDIERYDYNTQRDKFDANEKVARLIYFYDEKVLPVTLVNGEIVQIEKSLTINQLVSEADLSPIRLQKSGIVLKSEATCGGCGGCSSKAKTEQCNSCSGGCCKENKCSH